MNIEEFLGDESDSDYCPENLQSESDSEPTNENDANEDHEEERESSKKRTKCKKSKKVSTKEQMTEKIEEEPPLDPEEEKRKADALWAQFLGDTSEKPTTETVKTTQSNTAAALQQKSNIPKVVEKPAECKKIFEFAGERVEVPSQAPLVKNESQNSNTPSTVKANVPLKRPGGGLGSVLNQISKKNKLNVLEKTKLDWNSFKSNEGISEELETHNRGKDGFLERRDFLERTDLRQFEIEKNMRLKKRTHK